MALQPGTRLGPYEIDHLLGAGGMGEVYRAHDTRLLRAVAVKVLPEGRPTDDVDVSRLRREAHAIAALNHPNICSIFDIGEHDNRPFFVMELLDGETLAHRLARGPLLDEAGFLAVGIALADALEAAHEKGIIHRDLKPANIFLTCAVTRRSSILDWRRKSWELTTRREPTTFRRVALLRVL
jgi:serine/threonine protein kinase